MPANSSLTTFQKIFHLLTFNGRKKFYWLIVAVVIMSLLDMVGIASIFPFLKVIASPTIIQENAKLKWLYNMAHLGSRDSFLIILGLCSFTLLAVSNVLRAKVFVALLRFSYLKRDILSKILLEKYLYEPYAFFLDRNTSELTSYLASEIAQIVSGVLIPCLQVFARLLMAILIIVLLVAVNPVVASGTIVVIGGGYAVLYMLLKKKLFRIGAEVTEHSKKILKSLGEAFGGIKDIKILGKEKFFVDRFSTSVKKNNECLCWQLIIFQLPRYCFEMLIFGGMLFVVIFILAVQETYQDVIPILGLYAFAAYRLVPTLQQIYQDLASIRSSLYALHVVYQDYLTCSGGQMQPETPQKQSLSFSKSITMRNISFKYLKAEKYVIEKFNLTIQANTTIGFVGGTGTGKTTLIDILVGLLRPQEGEIVVDGQVINDENLRKWQANIGYVPQNIYLCDDTVSQNIAFGIPDDHIDYQAVENSAKLANIHDFITKELPHGYDTEIGERGVRLSGGQRQRIGIARSLYHNPLLLVFDEATSALDGITEDAILEAIHKLAHQKTIMIITHRLSTVKECDTIYFMEKGRIIEQGTYHQLLSKNEQFRKMAKITKEEKDLLEKVSLNE